MDSEFQSASRSDKDGAASMQLPLERRSIQFAFAGLLALAFVVVIGFAVNTGPSVASQRDVRDRPLIKVDLNTATANELALLPSVGLKLAKRIVEKRDASGPFRSVSDLAQIRGIGEKEDFGSVAILFRRFPFTHNGGVVFGRRRIIRRT